ncbi:MAG TPA: hypothetical protein ENI94_03855 [Gammaproteobacteria bacterium]|nr:hypothetical protein [Gammaproteobacteria bacterium]
MRNEALFSRTKRVRHAEDDAAASYPAPRLAEETGISDVTLYHWRKQARVEGIAVPADRKNPEKWPSEDKFAIVLETAPLNEARRAEYCRQKGRYAEQIEAWRKACEILEISVRT